MHQLLACMKRCFLFCCLLCSLLPVFAQEANTPIIQFSHKAGYFPLVHQSKPAVILVDEKATKVIHIAAAALQKDIREITGVMPAIKHQADSSDGFAMIIGAIGESDLLQQLSHRKKVNTNRIAGKWETFSIEVINKPGRYQQQALVIMGSDARGTAFGVFEFCRMMGVSPWTWWADVHPEKHAGIYVSPGTSIQGPPSVQYRGIFLNDEDWGLQPWAARQMDTAVKDIGPNTYARIFELLLRLKANYIWPAMHPCTRAFYYYPQNPVLANDYSIVVGSSHCEPMLRNNVFEWAENYEHEYGTKPGEWRYDLNKDQIYRYWEDRIKQSASYPSVYTVGMRGIHDGSMPGPKPIPEKVKLLEQIIQDQRQLLSSRLNKPSQAVPQIFCPYKEVLTIYRNGLQLPEDITIVWADDNHGYLRQLSGAKEQQRSGGSGVYYHLSYWGAPHDYLWLSTISPSLISYEMTRAYEHGAKRLWVFNVGDIKPAELEISFAMDLAWNVNKWKPEQANNYAAYWAGETFGSAAAKPIAAIKQRYYTLANAGKPEHLGNVRFTAAEADQRLAAYRQISQQAKTLYASIPAHLKDAYFQLVWYPVEGARLMNEKILYANKSMALAAVQKDSALMYATKATKAFQQVRQLTAQYNDSIAGGKWKGMMSWHPRDLPVFNMPRVATEAMIDSIRQSANTAITPEKKAASVTAYHFTNKQVPGFRIIEGLGITGKGVTLAPGGHRPTDTNFTTQPFLEYKLPVTAGTHTLFVKCLPTQSVNGSGQLRYAISVNGDTPQVVNVHTESESNVWKQNVLRGYSLGKTIHTIQQSGTCNIRIYLLDEGLVLNQLEIE